MDSWEQGLIQDLTVELRWRIGPRKLSRDAVLELRKLVLSYADPKDT